VFAVTGPEVGWTPEIYEEGVNTLLNFPVAIFFLSFLFLWLAAWVGKSLAERLNAQFDDETRTDFGVIQAASLTLLGLIIGFSFSMATGRYDLRKSYEEAEANAIGTEYVRADLLPPDEAARVRALLREYTAERIRFYTSRSSDNIDQIRADVGKLQDRLWTAVAQTADAQPTPLRALAVAGMNDVLNSEGYTQAAWWNRIPVAAWCLMFGIALLCNVLVGYGTRRLNMRLFMVLPLVVSIAFFLIADIDSPRGGVIRVQPQNLERLQGQLK
jgi:hypothetical protein